MSPSGIQIRPSIWKLLGAALAITLGCFQWSGARAEDAKDKEKIAPPAWHGNVALGLSITKGNSDTLTLNASALAEKLMPRDEIRLGVEGTYGLNNFGRTNEIKNAEFVHGFGDYKHLFNDRFYADLRLDAFHDGLADIAYRVNIGPAAGYYFIKSAQSRLSAEVGPGFQILRQGGETKKYATLRAGERGEHSFNKAVKIWEEVNYFPQVDDFKNYLILSEVGVEAALNTRLSLRVVAQDKYNNVPAPGRKSNDIILITALVWKY